MTTSNSPVDYTKLFPFRMLPLLYGRGENWQPTDKQLANFERYVHVGDPLADALVTAIKGPEGRQIRQQFEQALVGGIDTVPDAPEVLRAFFESVENVPYWVDDAKLHHASEVLAGIGPIAAPMLMVGLSVTYTTPDGNAVLLRAGDTRDKAGSRATETLAWVIEVTAPDGLKHGAPGFQSSVRVRLTHAFLRSGMMQRGDWDNPHLAVNQQVYSNVIVAFAAYPTLAALVCGKRFTRRDREAIYHLWRYVAHLVGVDPNLIPTSEADAMRLFWLFLKTVIQPDESATLLGTALIDAYPQIYGFNGSRQIDKVARWFILNVHSGLAHTTLGARISKQLGYPRVSPLAVPLLISSSALFGLTTVLDRIPMVRRLRCRFMGRAQQRLLARMCKHTEAGLLNTLNRQALAANHPGKE